MVDVEIHRMSGLRLPQSTEKIRTVLMKLTVDSGAQVTACNVSLLGLRQRNLLSTAVGLECANMEDV